ncbi:MAG TPA: response regulator transcription factor [Candidatus Koribacter sp.]
MVQAKPTSARSAARILIADDDPIVREILRNMLAAQNSFTVLGEARNGEETVKLARELKPDLLLLDLLMPNLPGLDALKEMTTSDFMVRTIVLTASITKQQVLQALQLGARGVVRKDALGELISAIRAVLDGQYWLDGKIVPNVVQLLNELAASTKASAPRNDFGLTPRELEIVVLVTEGCGNREIAGRLTISEETVKRHLTHIFDKVGMSTRLELALFALDHGLARRS